MIRYTTSTHTLVVEDQDLTPHDVYITYKQILSNGPATILSDIKKMLNIQPEVKEFDIDVISHINGAFLTLYQLGVGPEHPFSIDNSTSWDSFETQIPKNVVRDYLYLKTKIVFDPPVASNVFEAYKERISELEFRMSIEVDNGGGIVVG